MFDIAALLMFSLFHLRPATVTKFLFLYFLSFTGQFCCFSWIKKKQAQTQTDMRNTSKCIQRRSPNKGCKLPLDHKSMPSPSCFQVPCFALVCASQHRYHKRGTEVDYHTRVFPVSFFSSKIETPCRNLRCTPTLQPLSRQQKTKWNIANEHTETAAQLSKKRVPELTGE